jgi:hypothetical protein
MITDAMLREAAAEAERFMLAHLPEVQEPHVFSKRFERKMQKLISRMKHPIRYQVKRYVAAILLAVILLFGTIFAVSLEVRATVIGWVRSTFLEFFQYSNDDTSKPVIAEYELTIIPEGYRQLNIIDKEDGKTYLYVNNDGVFLDFTYAYAIGSNDYFTNAEDCEQYSAIINGINADIYVSKAVDETSLIVWQDPLENILFHISAKANKAELIELAESVQKRN